jgi:hypothetical protein
MNNMTSLMAHYQENPQLNPPQAMHNWVSTMASNPALQQQNANQMQGGLMSQNPMIQQGMVPQQQGTPQGARTPSNTAQLGIQPNHQFMSPAMAAGILPPNGSMNGSPHLMQQSHTPSPASHTMVAQHSQSSNTASVNTSPNVSNKRRRSTAKVELDGDGEMNGVSKVRPSPRIGGNKRVKANTNN